MILKSVLRQIPAAARSSACAQRWVSYNKVALRTDVLQAKVEADLNKEGHGHSIRLDSAQKVISTATGDLPLSPVFDPKWMQARRRQRKGEPGKPTGRFRKKLAHNTYAQALATPIRRCCNTFTWLPRYFLQDFEQVKRPSDQSIWWAPGSLAWEHLGSNETVCSSDEKTAADTADEKMHALSQPSEQLNDETSADAKTVHTKWKTSPITAYLLSRQRTVDRIGGPDKRHAAMLLASRTGMAVTPDTRKAVWREDMGDVFLKMMRRHATDALLTATRSKGSRDEVLIQACQTWDHAKEVTRRGCVLWLPDHAAAQYSTLDIEGAKYGRKVAVHSLPRLLGESMVEELRNSSSEFRDHTILVLRQGQSRSAMGLHLLLWRLEGYLAKPPSS